MHNSLEKLSKDTLEYSRNPSDYEIINKFKDSEKTQELVLFVCSFSLPSAEVTGMNCMPGSQDSYYIYSPDHLDWCPRIACAKIDWEIGPAYLK